MLIDTNAYLGFYAFRHLRHNTADGLLRLMDEKGIDRAMVSNPAAITYRSRPTKRWPPRWKVTATG